MWVLLISLMAFLILLCIAATLESSVGWRSTAYVAWTLGLGKGSGKNKLEFSCPISFNRA